MDFDFISKTFVRLLAALPLTLSVWFLSVVLGALIAAGVTWMRVSGVKPFEWFARAYVMVFRGTPLLIQLFVVYYGLASLPAVRASFAWKDIAAGTSSGWDVTNRWRLQWVSRCRIINWYCRSRRRSSMPTKILNRIPVINETSLDPYIWGAGPIL